MSLATRCTHCGTIFKVVQDQLKVSEGWVRCGRCHEVFNALPALFDLDTEAPPPRQVPPKPPAYAQQPPAPTTQPIQPPQAPVRPPAARPEPPGPATWSRTQPAGLDTPPAATPAAAEPPAAATDFDLDTSVDLSDPAPLWSPPVSEPPAVPRAAAAVAPAARAAQAAQPAASPAAAPGPETWAGTDVSFADEPRPWLDEPPEDVPSTDESDALESRYLLPSRDGARPVRPVRRRERGPEFADAQFPSDLDAEQEWARYQDSVPAPLTEPPPMSSLLPEPAAAPRPKEPAQPAGGAATSLEGAKGHPVASAMPGAAAAEPAPPGPADAGYVPEQPVQPPSQRKGRSGTRGRDPASQPPEFVRRAQRQAFWRLPAVQATLALLALLLTLGLTVQLAHHFRDWIAAYHPSTRPLLNAWCAQVGCQIQPPMRLDALQVDSATLVRTASEGPDRYRLTVAVNNRAEVELAWPHIDLTLTDDRGTVIARRAFAPRDAQVAKGEGMPLLSVPGAVPAGESTQLQWSLRLDDLAPAGYTAELFYP